MHVNTRKTVVDRESTSDDRALPHTTRLWLRTTPHASSC